MFLFPVNEKTTGLQNRSGVISPNGTSTRSIYLSHSQSFSDGYEGKNDVWV